MRLTEASLRLNGGFSATRLHEITHRTRTCFVRFPLSQSMSWLIGVTWFLGVPCFIGVPWFLCVGPSQRSPTPPRPAANSNPIP